MHKDINQGLEIAVKFAFWIVIIFLMSKGSNAAPTELLPDSGETRESFNSYFDGDVFSFSRNFGLSCSICVEMDHKFFKYHFDNNSTIMNSNLEQLFDYVSWIFRSTDWNDDGLPENIGFHLKRVKTDWNPSTGESNLNKLPMEFLIKLGEINFDDCCVGIGLTMQPFKNPNQVGASFTVQDRIGGICNHQLSSVVLPDGTIYPYKLFTNIVLISGLGMTNDSPSLLSLSDILLVLIHELGHTFGITTHDNDINMSISMKARQNLSPIETNKLTDAEDEACIGYKPKNNYFETKDYSSTEMSSFSSSTNFHSLKLRQVNNKRTDDNNNDGNFIMWPRTMQGKNKMYPNNFLFSSCSKQFARNFLHRNSKLLAKCLLRDKESFCGNGIVESTEECDCGNELKCKQDPCCGSRSSTNPCKLIRYNIIVRNRSLAMDAGGNLTIEGEIRCRTNYMSYKTFRSKLEQVTITNADFVHFISFSYFHFFGFWLFLIIFL